MTFDQFKKLLFRDIDIEKFRDSFCVMLDVNGAIASDTVGFNISVRDESGLDSDDSNYIGYEKQALEIINIFKPPVIWSGSQAVIDRLHKLGHDSILFPWFQDGAFVVVLKIPRRKCDEGII